MKLSDVVQRMQSNSSYGHDGDFTASYMRRACEAMRDEIVPEEEKDKYNHEKSCDCPICCAMVSHNVDREKLINKIEEFIGEEK